MTKTKLLSAAALSIAMLATPAAAQVVVTQEPGAIGYSYYPYGHKFNPGPGYYIGNRFQPAPRVGAFATQPWTDDSYGYYGAYVAPY